MSESIANIVELVGSSDKGWEEAVEVALQEATKTIRGITGLDKKLIFFTIMIQIKLQIYSITYNNLKIK